DAAADDLGIDLADVQHRHLGGGGAADAEAGAVGGQLAADLRARLAADDGQVAGHGGGEVVALQRVRVLQLEADVDREAVVRRKPDAAAAGHAALADR